MPLQKLFFMLCVLGLLIATHQEITLDDNDTGVTVTHPSVFHEDHSDYRITIKGSADDHLYGPKNHPETLDYGERVRSIFELADESSSSSSSDSSDITDASESSDNEAKRKAFQDISERMKNFEEQAMREIKKQKEFAQAHGKEPWQTLKPKRRDGPHSVNVSADERQKLENAKREFEEAWKDFQTKFKNGEDVSEYINTTD